MYSEYKEIREELLEELKKYETTLSEKNYKYLESLVNLDCSVVNDTAIKPADKSALNRCPIFKKIAVYNFYNRPVKLLNQLESDLKKETGETLGVNYNNTSCRSYSKLGATVKLSDREFSLFDIYYTNTDQFGKRWLVDAHRISNIGSDADLSAMYNRGIVHNDLLQTEVTNYFYRLLMADFGIKDNGARNVKNGLYSCFDISTDLHNFNYFDYCCEIANDSRTLK